MYTKADMKNYANELWVSLNQYEDQLKGEVKGHEIIHRKKEMQSRCKISSVLQQTQFYLTAIESAYIESKIHFRRETDRA